MLQIGDKVLSLDIIQKKFICDLSKCKGACCIHGDSGAPLEEDEAETLDREYEKIKPYLRPEGHKTIERAGKHMVDSDGDTVTPLIDNKECAYVIFDGNGIAKCGIETAYNEGAITFKKPISCHLYPIRRKKYKDFQGLNYDRWEICKPAVKLGNEKDVYIHEFLEEPLTRAFGKEWCEQLQIAAIQLNQANG